MPRLSFRRIIRRPITLLPLLINLAVLLPQPANAELYTTNGANDFYFTIETEQQFTVRTYAAQYGIDSMLWLYDAANNLLVANDDHFGLDSYITTSLPAGTYRLRTGVCCGDPNRWYGNSYQIDTSFAVVGGVEITTTTQEPTTTTEASTTTAAPPTTETTVPDTRLPESTTTSTENLPASTEPEPTTTTSELPPTSVTQPDVPVTVETTIPPAVDSTTVPEPTTTLLPETTTSSISTPTTVSVPSTTTSSVAPTTTQPVVVAPTTTTTSEPAPQSEQVGSTTTVPPTTVPFTVPEVVVELPPVDVLLELPPDQLQEVFESIDMEALTPEQQEQLIEQLTSAPDEVKKEFEETINVFSGGFDTYVPTGSTVDVGTRRVIVAVTSVLSVLPIPSSAPPSAPTSGPAGGAPSDGGGTTSEEKPRRARRGRI